jgi:hypothetical protein
VPSSQDGATDASIDVRLKPGLLTHLTRLTRFCTSRSDARLPNDPAALPSAGGSLRALELDCDYEESIAAGPRVILDALLPVAAGLESLDIADSRITPADAVRLAAALPRDMARLHIGTWSESSAWAALPMTTSLDIRRPPADLALLAGATRLERLTVGIVQGAAPDACAAALQALPRLRVLQLGTQYARAFRKGPPSGGSAAAAPSGAEASDAFVAAAARLPSLQYLGLSGFHVGYQAEAALLEAAPRLSALRLEACGLSAEAAAGLAAQLRAAAGRGPLSSGQHPPRNDDWRRRGFFADPIDCTTEPLDVFAGALP